MTASLAKGNMTSIPEYKRNFLTDVIFRIDYPSIADLISTPPKEFQDKLFSKFPILEPTKQLGVKIETSGENITTTEESKTIWRFKNKTASLIVELDSKFLVIVTKEYKNHTSFKESVSEVLKAFFEVYPDTILNRVGLRYINQITLKEKGFYEWGKYIDKNLISIIDFVSNKKDIRRALQLFEIQIDSDTRLNMKAGIFNSTYPNELIKKEFLLDYDCYTTMSTEKDEVGEKLDIFNKIIAGYFENSITDNFRKEVLSGE